MADAAYGLWPLGVHAYADTLGDLPPHAPAASLPGSGP